RPARTVRGFSSAKCFSSVAQRIQVSSAAFAAGGVGSGPRCADEPNRVVYQLQIDGLLDSHAWANMPTMRTPEEARRWIMLSGLLAVLIVGTLAGSVDAESGRSYPRYDRGYYGGNGAYGGCGDYRGYAGCGYGGCRGYGWCGRYGSYGGDGGYGSYGGYGNY